MGPPGQRLTVLWCLSGLQASIMQPTRMLCIAFTALLSLAQGRVLLVDDGEPLPSTSPRTRLIAGARSDVRQTAFYRVPAHLWPPELRSLTSCDSLRFLAYEVRPAIAARGGSASAQLDVNVPRVLRDPLHSRAGAAVVSGEARKLISDPLSCLCSRPEQHEQSNSLRLGAVWAWLHLRLSLPHVLCCALPHLLWRDSPRHRPMLNDHSLGSRSHWL